MRYPIDTNQYFISNGYQSGHLALDLAANQGVHVKAPESGMVVGFNKDPSSYFGGLYVVIAGDSGHRHYMGHHSAVHVNLNQRVSEGQHIASVGSTGLATGPHVHWEVTKNGAAVNPANIAKQSQGVISMARKIVNSANWRWRFQRLHWQLVGNWNMSDKVFQSIVGQDPWTVVEGWSDHPNANQSMEYQRIGQMAVQDKWQKQIYDLQAQVKSLGTRPTKSQLDAANKKASELAAAMKSAQAMADKDKKQAELVDAKIKALEEEQVKSKREAENFMTAVINSVRNLFK